MGEPKFTNSNQFGTGPIEAIYDYQIFALQKRGGVSRYFVSIWEEFKKVGYVRPELYLGVNQTGLDQEIHSFAKVSGFRAKDPLFPKTRWLMWMINSFAFQREIERSKATIVHPTYFRVPRNLFGKKLVVTVYDLVHELYPKLFSPRDYVFRWRPEAVRRADLILAISETTKRDLCSYYGITPDKVFVTPLGCSLPSISHGVSNETPQKPMLLYVGERGGYKNFEVLANAWRIYADLNQKYRLVCFGGSSPSDSEKALPGDVEFRRGTDEELAVAYSQASALIYPSLYEGFGLPLLEAFHYRCPVITTGCGSIREVANEAAAYFDPKSPGMLFNSIKTIRENSEYRNTLIEAGSARVKSYSWKRCADQTVEAYRIALGQK